MDDTYETLKTVTPVAALVAAGAASVAYLSGYHPFASTSSLTETGVSADKEVPELPRGAWTTPRATSKDVEGKDIKITQLWVHPIKSCRGTSVQEAKYTPIGMENDRKWGIIDAKTHKVVTARELPKMVLINPEIVRDPSSEEGGVLHVSFPLDSGCEGFEIPLNPSPATLAQWEVLEDTVIWESSGLQSHICLAIASSTTNASNAPADQISRFLSRDLLLVMKSARLDRPCDPSYAFPNLKAKVEFQDGYPLLVAAEESLKETVRTIREFAAENKKGVESEWESRELHIRRFRPNIVFEGAGIPFAEDAFKEIVVLPSGSDMNRMEYLPRITLVSKCTRCRLPNTDPETGIVDESVPFKVLMSFRTGLAREKGLWAKSCFGSNGVPTGEGVVRVGDRVRVTGWFDEAWM